MKGLSDRKFRKAFVLISDRDLIFNIWQGLRMVVEWERYGSSVKFHKKIIKMIRELYQVVNISILSNVDTETLWKWYENLAKMVWKPSFFIIFSQVSLTVVVNWYVLRKHPILNHLPHSTYNDILIWHRKEPDFFQKQLKAESPLQSNSTRHTTHEEYPNSQYN